MDPLHCEVKHKQNRWLQLLCRLPFNRLDSIPRVYRIHGTRIFMEEVTGGTQTLYLQTGKKMKFISHLAEPLFLLQDPPQCHGNSVGMRSCFVFV